MSPVEILKFLYDLFVYIVLLRFLLQLVRADFYNPFSQFVVTMTQWILSPLRRIIPGSRGIDWSSLLLFLALVLLGQVLFGFGGSLIGMLIMLPFTATIMLINLLLFLVFIKVILSWVDPYQQQPMQRPLSQLTNPILAPFRRLIPPIGMIDLSALFAILALYLARWFVERLPFWMFGLFS